MDTSFKQRLIFELIDLHDKRLNLENFIENNEIDETYKKLLTSQLDAMMEYEGILTNRLIIHLEDK